MATANGRRLPANHHDMARDLAPVLDTDMVLPHICKIPPSTKDQIPRRLRRLCQIALDQSSQPSPPFNETRVYRVLFTLGTFLVILAAMCALYFALCLIPLPPPPPSPPNGETRCASDQASHEDRESTTSSSIGGTSNTRIGPGRRTPTSGVHAGSDDTASPGLQADSLPPVADARPHAPLSSDDPSLTPSPKSTPAVESAACRGVASNPAQAECLPPSPTIDGRETITKSLYPQAGAIEQDRDDWPSSPTHLPRRSRLTPPGDAPLADAQLLTTWFILLIAVGTNDVRDPRADLGFIVQAFDSPKVHLVSIGDEATRTSIQHELRQLYFQAQQNPASQIVIYLTGSGDSFGNMALSEGATISAQDLKCWLAELDAGPTSPRPMSGVIFDICRDGAVHTNPNIDPDLAVVWSCSAGQRSWALDLGPDLPSSSFLVSVFLAAHDSRTEPKDFEHEFEFRLAQQGALLRFIYDRGHESECAKCLTTDPCCLPSPQVSEYRQPGRDMFLRLGDLIRVQCPDVACHIHAELTGKMIRWRFLDPEPWYRSFQLGRWMQRLVHGLVIGHPRGSTAAVAQAALDLPECPE